MQKIDLKSMFIGVLCCVCFFLIMAHTKGDSLISEYETHLYERFVNETIDSLPQIGRYQITSNSQTRMLYLLDTVTGKTYASIYGEEWVEEIDVLRK